MKEIKYAENNKRVCVGERSINHLVIVWKVNETQLFIMPYNFHEVRKYQKKSIRKIIFSYPCVYLAEILLHPVEFLEF